MWIAEFKVFDGENKLTKILRNNKEVDKMESVHKNVRFYDNYSMEGYKDYLQRLEENKNK